MAKIIHDGVGREPRWEVHLGDTVKALVTLAPDIYSGFTYIVERIELSVSSRKQTYPRVVLKGVPYNWRMNISQFEIVETSVSSLSEEEAKTAREMPSHDDLKNFLGM